MTFKVQTFRGAQDWGHDSHIVCETESKPRSPRVSEAWPFFVFGTLAAFGVQGLGKFGGEGRAGCVLLAQQPVV